MLRIGVCLLAVILLLANMGCGGGVAKVTPKVAPKVFGALKQEARDALVQQGLEYAAGAVTGGNSVGKKDNYNSPSGTKSKAAAVVGGAAAVAGATAGVVNAQKGGKTLEAGNVLISYYQAIAAGRMSEAYNSLSWEMQNQLGTYESFSQGYTSTVSNDVTDIRGIAEGDDYVVLSYELHSVDNINGRLVRQTFLGEATLALLKGHWLITDFNVRVK